MSDARLSPEMEDWRRVCEARSWLRQGYTSAGLVDALIARIARHRGQQAAEALREEMRRQWRCRRQWMEIPE
jgi:DNA-binding helix-hairpin-helix protein with protein kinase domain